MRLWHEALIPYLDRQRLLGLHREVCALRGNGWGRKHATVNYVFEHPYEWLVAYHGVVMIEMKARGYHVDEKWHDSMYRGKKCPMMECFDLETYMDANCSAPYIYPEHNATYLQECLDNLAGKGIHIDMEVKNNGY